MPLEEQTTQAIKEGTEAVARIAVRLTAHGAQALIQAVFGISKAAVHKTHQAIKEHRTTGKMSLKNLNRKTGGATARLDFDFEQGNRLAAELGKSGIDFHISQNRKNGTALVDFPLQASQFVQDTLSRIHPTMSADDINQTIADAQETVRELNDPDMEKVDKRSLDREEVEEVGLKEAGIPMEAGSATVSAERPDYWHATPATSRQKELIGEQVAQGFIPEKEAREFLQGEPTISQANEFLNRHPQPVDHLDLYGQDNISQVKARKKGHKLTKKDVQKAVKKGAQARSQARRTTGNAQRHTMKKPATIKK